MAWRRKIKKPASITETERSMAIDDVELLRGMTKVVGRWHICSKESRNIDVKFSVQQNVLVTLFSWFQFFLRYILMGRDVVSLSNHPVLACLHKQPTRGGPRTTVLVPSY
uniref:Uncharacterized protein n=1 Tax=Rhizophora mucronata TaxID=61149 RepID=A0A2P2QSY6_RHIMU